MSELKLTATEQILMYELKLVREQRDDAREELNELKQKSKDTFSVYMLAGLAESNGGYHHPTNQTKMFIKKDGQAITLDPDEIKKVVACAGGNFRR